MLKSQIKLMTRRTKVFEAFWRYDAQFSRADDIICKAKGMPNEQ